MIRSWHKLHRHTGSSLGSTQPCLRLPADHTLDRGEISLANTLHTGLIERVGAHRAGSLGKGSRGKAAQLDQSLVQPDLDLDIGGPIACDRPKGFLNNLRRGNRRH